MTRAWFVNGETMVAVKGNVNTSIAALTYLGLAVDQVSVTPDFRHQEINVNAWGEIPAEIQWMNGAVMIHMNLVNFDIDVLDICLQESMGGATALGSVGRAGQLMGNNVARFAAGNHFIGLNLLSPVAGKPYRFWYAYLAAPPITFPLGVDKSIISLNWRAIPYSPDPWGGATAQPGTVAGTGAAGAVIWDRTLDV